MQKDSLLVQFLQVNIRLLLVSIQIIVKIKKQGETNFFKWLLTDVYPTGIFSYVADSYDYWGFLEEIVPSLKILLCLEMVNGYVVGTLVM